MTIEKIANAAIVAQVANNELASLTNGCKMVVTIENATECDLCLEAQSVASDGATSGKFVKGPNKTIEPGQASIFSSEKSTNSLQGNHNFVCYRLLGYEDGSDGGVFFYLGWDNPYVGDTTYDCGWWAAYDSVKAYNQDNEYEDSRSFSSHLLSAETKSYNKIVADVTFGSEEIVVKIFRDKNDIIVTPPKE